MEIRTDQRKNEYITVGIRLIKMKDEIKEIYSKAGQFGRITIRHNPKKKIYVITVNGWMQSQFLFLKEPEFKDMIEFLHKYGEQDKK